MKPELTYDIVAKTVHKRSQKARKSIKFREEYGTLIFAVLFGLSMIGGFFIWFRFDLFGPKHLSFLGIVWGAIWFAASMAFAAYAYNENEEDIKTIEDCYYVVEDIVLDVRHRPDNKNLLYFSFANLKKYHNYNYIKIPKQYKEAKPGDRFLLVFDDISGDVIFMCKDTEYEIPFKYKKPTQCKNILQFVSVKELDIKYCVCEGVKLNDKNSVKKLFTN